MSEPPSLSDFAAGRERATRRAYLDTLPDEIQTQVAASHDLQIPATVVAEWLNELGYDQATWTMVCRWRREQSRKASSGASG